MWHFLFKKFSFHVRLNLKQIILLKSNLNHTDPIKKKIWFLFNKHTTTQEREGEERRRTHTLACRDTASLCWQKWPFASKPCFLSQPLLCLHASTAIDASPSPLLLPSLKTLSGIAVFFLHRCVVMSGRCSMHRCASIYY